MSICVICNCRVDGRIVNPIRSCATTKIYVWSWMGAPLRWTTVNPTQHICEHLLPSDFASTLNNLIIVAHNNFLEPTLMRINVDHINF